MIDISFTGGSVVIEAGAIGATVINEFSDEGSPVEVDEIEVTGHAINMSGLLIRWRKSAAYTVKVSVIPGSNNDVSLTKLLEASHVRHVGGAGGVSVVPIAELKTSMTIYAPQVNKSGVGADNSADGRMWKFTEGTIVSGQPGIASDAEGKMQSKTFSFVFERMDPPTDDGEKLFANFTPVA